MRRSSLLHHARLHHALLLAVLMVFVACSSDTAVPCPWPAPPSIPVDLRVTVLPTEVGLLQPVTVTVDRFRQDGVEVSFVAKVDDKQFVTQDEHSSEERAFGDGFWQRTTLTLLPIDGPGELQIPAFHAETVAKDGEIAQIATTQAQSVTVTTTLGPEYGAAIEAPGDPFPTPFRIWLWLGVAAGLLLLAGLLVWWWTRRKVLQHSITIAVPAHVKALRELLRWRSASRTTEREIDAFYVGVSQVLRVYLEERFALHAPERTTEEFLRELEQSTQLVRDHGSDLQQFLSQCDLVKFAKFVPDEAQHQRTYQLAESFIESTRADRSPDPVAVESGESKAQEVGA